MIKIAIVLSMFVAAGLLIPALSQASDAILETSHLTVNDTTGKLSNEQLRRLADHAQETLNRILVFWAVDPGIGRFGKIRVVFDVPRRDVYSSVFYWDKKDGRPMRVVGVFGTDRSPQMMAHKLTSAVFPQKDKLIRNKIKQFHRLSHEKDRPWQDVFGIGMQELEANWLKTLRANEKTREENVSIVLKLFERNPGTACAEAQKLVTGKR